MTLVTVTGYAL